MTDRSGRTYEEYRQLYWDEKARRKIAEVKVANFESDAYVLSLLTKLDELQTQLDNHRKQADHWLTLLDKAEAQLELERRMHERTTEHWLGLKAQLESIYDRFVDGNCTETYINIAPLIKAAIGEES